MFQNNEAVVAAAHSQAPPQRRNDGRTARGFGLAIAPKEAVEMLVMSDFVFDDAPRQQRQNRLWAGARQRRVVAGCAGLDDAARGHFEAAGGLQRRVAEGSEFLDEPPVGWLPAEFRPRGFDVAAQRPAVLQFLGEPVMLEP